MLCTVYRPPRHTLSDLNADFADLQAQLQHVTVNYPHLKVFMCGDLNCCLLKRDMDPAKRTLTEFLSDNSLAVCRVTNLFYRLTSRCFYHQLP